MDNVRDESLNCANGTYFDKLQSFKSFELFKVKKYSKTTILL